MFGDAQARQLEELINSVPLTERLTFIENTRKRLPPRQQRLFEDLLNIASARCDDIAAIEYIMKTPKGKPIRLGVCQKLMIDFGSEAHAEGLISIIYAPMGVGKTTIMLGKRALKIGKDPNIRLQILSASDEPATERCEGLRRLIETPHFRKVYPNIKPGKQWAKHKFTVDRSFLGEAARREDFSEEGESGAINSTCSAYGVDSSALGSRSDDTLGDDIPTYENSIEFPSKGEHIFNKLKTKFFSRRESPLGVPDEGYTRKDDPWRIEFICTPWAETDPIYKLRFLPTAATIRMGVNSTFTGYNVEIWGLPDEAIARLKAKYSVGEGEVVDSDFPPKAVFTIPLFRPRQWYLDRYSEDEREFDRMYRCKVYTESERAFPEYARCLVDDLIVQKTQIFIDRSDKKNEPTGWLAQVMNPSPEVTFRLCTVDLSGAARQGTVLTTMSLMVPDFTRELLEVAVGAWAGNEIIDQMGEVFERLYNRGLPLDLMLVEDAAQQKMFIQLAMANRQKYPWMVKVGFFEGVSHKKGDQQLGVLTMATPVANYGFRIPNTKVMADHPVFGSPNYPKGCPCGVCRLNRDMKNQLRTAEIKSDDIMAFWMNHSSMPMIKKTGESYSAAGEVVRVKSGYQLMQPGKVSEKWGGQLTRDMESTTMEGVLKDNREIVPRDPEVYNGKKPQWGPMRGN